MDLYTLYHRTVECWADRVNAVGAGQWDDPTPCTEWTVSDLVNHVVSEDLWTVPLMEGQTIAEVGDRFDGDVLGADPVVTALDAAKGAVSVVGDRLPAGKKVHLSYGDEEAAEYVRQLAADHLVHSWDLAAATGGTTHLDPQLVTEVAAWFTGQEDTMRSFGVIAPRRELVGERQADLLARFGRDGNWGKDHAALARFNAAFATGDVDAIMALMTEDCVFESTSPAPDGQRHEGASAVRSVWKRLFTQTSQAEFTAEETIVCRGRAVVRWRFSWCESDGSPGHVRGVDVMRIRDGKVSEKLSYVKG
jgi:uncharacterized protein (TIGR03086 family)